MEAIPNSANQKDELDKNSVGRTAKDTASAPLDKVTCRTSMLNPKNCRIEGVMPRMKASDTFDEIPKQFLFKNEAIIRDLAGPNIKFIRRFAARAGVILWKVNQFSNHPENTLEAHSKMPVKKA